MESPDLHFNDNITGLKWQQRKISPRDRKSVTFANNVVTSNIASKPKLSLPFNNIFSGIINIEKCKTMKMVTSVGESYFNNSPVQTLYDTVGSIRKTLKKSTRKLKRLSGSPYICKPKAPYPKESYPRRSTRKTLNYNELYAELESKSSDPFSIPVVYDPSKCSPLFFQKYEIRRSSEISENKFTPLDSDNTPFSRQSTRVRMGINTANRNSPQRKLAHAEFAAKLAEETQKMIQRNAVPCK